MLRLVLSIQRGLVERLKWSFRTLGHSLKLFLLPRLTQRHDRVKGLRRVHSRWLLPRETLRHGLRITQVVRWYNFLVVAARFLLKPRLTQRRSGRGSFRCNLGGLIAMRWLNRNRCCICRRLCLPARDFTRGVRWLLR